MSTKSFFPMSDASKFNRPAIFTFTGLILLAGLIGWQVLSFRPIYSNSHNHSKSESHNHLHTHDEGHSHGHQHFGLVGTTTHTHPHQHLHHHHDAVGIPEVEHLTEIGHRHTSGPTAHFWAKAEVVNNSVLLRCWTHHGQELVEIAPVIRSASLFNGSQFVCDVDFKRTDGKSVGRLPTVYFHLPTHTLKLVDLRIDGSEFDTVVPLELRQN